MALMRGCHPVDGSVLRPMGRSSTVAAIDLTFSAPKSVSRPVRGRGRRGVGQRCRGARAGGRRGALAFLEREACSDPSRPRRRGARPRARGSSRLRTGTGSRGPATRSCTRTSWSANLTRADGRYTALDAHALYEHKSAAGAVYRAVLRAEVRERLPWVSWRQVGRGLFEIEGVPEGGVAAFLAAASGDRGARWRARRRRRRTAVVAGADAGDRARDPPSQDRRWRRSAGVAGGRAGPGRRARVRPGRATRRSRLDRTRPQPRPSYAAAVVRGCPVRTG